MDAQPWKSLENEVAAIFLTLGAEVTQSFRIAGTELDLLVTETTASGNKIRTAVECKSFTGPVSTQSVLAYLSLVQVLRSQGIIDKAILVATSAFSKRALDAAREYGVELLAIDELRARVSDQRPAVAKEEKAIEAQQLREKGSARKSKRVFVVMPFADQFDDVYVLGIREVAERLGLIAERGDDIEHNQEILGLIQERIRTSDVVVADTTENNPNVFYEVGFAHACGKPTILVTRTGNDVPFDLQALSHIFYPSIVALRVALEKRLRATLGLPAAGET